MSKEKTMMSRRNVLASGAAMLTASAAGLLRRTPLYAAADSARRHAMAGGKGAYVPVVTPNGSTLPWRWEDGRKTFHLIAEPVVREFAPGLRVNCWGYNGQTPGPTLEAVEGDRVRIYVENRLPEPTTVHWHGVLLPNGMEGLQSYDQDPGWYEHPAGTVASPVGERQAAAPARVAPKPGEMTFDAVRPEAHGGPLAVVPIRSLAAPAGTMVTGREAGCVQ